MILLTAILAIGTAAASDLPEYKPDPNAARSAVPAAYAWNLSPLFPSDEAWEKARVKVLADVPALSKFKGRLADAVALRECLQLYFLLHKDANFVTLYSNLRGNVALSDDVAGAMVQKGLDAMDELMRAAGFIRQELLAMPGPTLEAAYAKEPALTAYRSYIDNLRRRANRILSPDAERALSLLGDNLWAEIDLNEIPSALEDTYSATLTDIPWPKVKDEQGQEVQFTLSSLPTLRRSPNRDVRRNAYQSYLATLRQYQHVLAAELGGQVKLDVAYARARGYDSSLEAYLDKDNVSTAVYDNLVSTIDANLPLLHRYVEVRKKILGLSDVHLYDLYVPLASGVAEDIPFSTARSTIIDALKPLGPDYGKTLEEGLNPENGWLDLYPHKDKESGAFSASVYGPHPYVLMNYMNSVDDMSTLAHEYGHALHSDLSMKNQPYANFRYVTMLAEIASTCNESLLNDYLVAHTADPSKKAYLLVERLESIRQTIFRQTMFSEFEREIHRMAEAGTPLTASILDKTYLDLVRKYYGPGFTTDPNDGMEWAGIPHFYYKYYVWSYATGMASGIAIADRVNQQGTRAADAYVGMLKGGCSQPPVELLKKAGVDLTRPDAIEASMRTFERTLNEVEKLLAK
jgi:oligoendopeptidase F